MNFACCAEVLSARLRAPFSTVCVWVKHPVDGLEYEVDVSHAWTCTPQHQGLVPVTHVPDVLGLVSINRRVRIGKSDSFANLLHILWFARQEGPSGTGMIHFSIVANRSHVVFLRLQSERVHEHFGSEIRPQALLYRGKIGGHPGADFVALGKEKIQRNYLSLD